MPQIHELLPLVMAEVGGVGKHGYNADQKYAFMSYADVTKACQDAFSKHSISVGTEVLELQRESRPTKSGGLMNVTIITIAHTFMAPDGSAVTVTTVGEGADTSDKASNKAMTAAMKYALRTLLVIPDQDDGDAETPEATTQAGAVTRSAPRAPAAPRSETGEKATEKQVKLAKFLLGRDFGGEFPENVETHFDFQVPSWESITKAQVSKLIDLLQEAPAVEKAERRPTMRDDLEGPM